MSFLYKWNVSNGDDVQVEYCWSSIDYCIKIVEMRVNGKFHRETWMSQKGRDELHQLLTDDYMDRHEELKELEDELQKHKDKINPGQIGES